MAHDGRQPSRRSFLRGAAATGGFLALNRFNSVELASFRGGSARPGRVRYRTHRRTDPFAQRGAVANVSLDHTSILSMIEWRWGLEPLTVRDAGAANLAEVLQFDAPDLRAKQSLQVMMIDFCDPAAQPCFVHLRDDEKLFP